jgi:RNA polymerase sigma-54 factor
MQKQHLQQKLQQKLSPLQLQVIKLLETPSIELEDRVKKELEENPALEEDMDFTEKDFDNSDTAEINDNENFSIDDYYNNEDSPEYDLNANNYSKDNEKDNIPVSAGLSFHEHLTNQLGLLHLSDNERFIAEYIIGNINNEGYLPRSPEEISDDIIFQTGQQIDAEEIVRILTLIQDFDPAGVAAKNLQECLLLQLNRKKQTESICKAIEIVTNSFDDFAKKHFEKIRKKLAIDANTFKKTIGEITKLNPKPGNAWESIWEKNKDEITPDFILENSNGELHLSLNNGNIPELRINKEYNQMLQDFAKNKEQTKDAKDAVFFVKQKIDSAKNFIEAIKQRQTTLLATMNAILKIQKEYLQTGDETLLKPMIMKDVAEMTGYDISTISRVSNSKYIETNFGIFPLKHFFSEAAQTENGEEISTRKIKALLTDFIEKENKKQPLTDDTLAEMLNKEGFIIARRTIAKYREQMNIPVARLRKEI